MDTVDNLQSLFCKYCNKEYTRKIFHERHELTCGIMYQTEKERKITMEESTDLPTVRQLYIIIQELAHKVKKLEKENEIINQFMKRKLNKCNIIEWLNKNIIPKYKIEHYFKDIVITDEMINYIINHSLETKIYNIITECLNKNKSDKLPICCFAQNKEKFYIYHFDSKKWKNMEDNIIVDMVYKIQKKIMVYFKDIYMNKDNLSEDIFDDMAKIMGQTNGGIERISSRIKRKIFDDIKFDVKNIVQYEF